MQIWAFLHRFGQGAGLLVMIWSCGWFAWVAMHAYRKKLRSIGLLYLGCAVSPVVAWLSVWTSRPSVWRWILLDASALGILVLLGNIIRKTADLKANRSGG